MAKDRQAVTCNGRPAFYACMWEDIRQCAMDCGWAVSLHGSLASDMDIMAMPWVDNAVAFKEMVDRVSKLFKDNYLSSQYTITYSEKPHGRVVATIPIWADFYLDISTISTADVVEIVRCKDCDHRYVPCRCALWYASCNGNEYFAERGDEFYCSYGKRKG